jgi:phosphonate transport system substrate-binding protein
MQAWLVLALLMCSIGLSHAAEAPQGKALEAGVVPYISARTLVTTYEPLRKYLEQSLARPIRLYTAPGFKAFQANSARGDFDLVITPAHFARILQKEYGYIVLARYGGGARGLIMVARDSTMQGIQDLRGQKVAVPDRLSLASILCIEYLKQNGLHPETGFHPVEAPSFNSALQVVQNGEAAAAISAPAALAQMPEALRNTVRILVDTGEYINLVFLAHPRLGAAETERLKKQLLQFGKNTPEGRQFLADTAFGSLIPVAAGELRLLDPYLPETKRLLEGTH